MTSVLPDEENNVTRLKRKSHSVLNKQCSDESRTFLTFSRENLSMSSCLELEQGFNRGNSSSSRQLRFCCCLCKRQTLLSCAALLLAFSCAVVELWKLRKVMANARDIEAIARDVAELKHRFLEKDLLDELRAFEEQLYSEDSNDEDNELSVGSNADYDYDDSLSPEPTTITTPSSLLVSSTTTRPCTSKDLEDVLAVLRRAEAEQKVRQRERLLEEERQKELARLSTKHRMDGEKKKKKKKRDTDFHTRLKRAARK